MYGLNLEEGVNMGNTVIDIDIVTELNYKNKL